MQHQAPSLQESGTTNKAEKQVTIRPSGYAPARRCLYCGKVGRPSAPPKVWLGDYRLLKFCTVLFVSCLCCVVTTSQAESTVNVPLTPIQEVLNSNQQDHCDLPPLRSQPLETALDHLYQAMGYIPIWQTQQRVQ